MSGGIGDAASRRNISINERAAGINKRISQALIRSDDPRREVKLIAVSKTFPVEKISEAVGAGLYRFGENKVQEIVPKSERLRGTNIEWHFIGHLQTNKVKKLLSVPTKYIHSVDRIELAEELDRQLQRKGEPREILIEVNTSGESTKSGVSPEDTAGLVQAVSRLDTLRIRGLMTIGALTENKDAVRKCFIQLCQIFIRLRGESIEGVEMKELSMGMSGDFETAIEEGATMIRVGTAIFGERTQSK